MLDPDLQRRLILAREFIDDCFESGPDLHQIAEQAALSPFHFQRLFRRTFDLTPHQYLTRRRVERAKELLVYTDLTISEICAIVGFSSLGSFSTLFSRISGMSPRAYRDYFASRFSIHVLLPEPNPARRVPACFFLMYGGTPGGLVAES